MSEIKDLELWAKDHGAYLDPLVEIHRFESCGLGFKAVQVIDPGRTIVTCPYRISLSYLNAVGSSHYFPHYNSTPFPEIFLNTFRQLPDDPNDPVGLVGPVIIGNFFLIQQFLMGESSQWYPYIRLLPQPDQPQSLAIPIWWPEEDRKFLDGTNAGPPLIQRKEIWRSQWKKGHALLKDRHENWQAYTYILYQWAATIFGSRSFRPSLTIPMILVGDSDLDNVRDDKFSVLLPLVDIGNHSGTNNIAWVPDPISNGLNLMTSSNKYSKGSQIFNYYGDKSNSELLLGYGFILPEEFNEDTVNIRVKPGVEALQLRRTQNCYRSPNYKQLDEEVIYTVHAQPIKRENDRRLEEFGVFSDDLVDMVASMVANKRERKYMSEHPDKCPEKDPNPFEGPLSRNTIHIMCLLHDKLEHEIQRISDAGTGLKDPKNSNQELGLAYRKRQITVLKRAMQPITSRLNNCFFLYSSYCQHPHLVANQRDGYHNESSPSIRVELLSLECAFDWLSSTYPSVFTAAEDIIATDQEESKPLNWAALVADWDHTFWVLWLYIVWMLRAQDHDNFTLHHKGLCAWMDEMDCYSIEGNLTEDEREVVFFGDTSEEGVVDLMIGKLNDDIFREISKATNYKATRNYASFISREETLMVKYMMQTGLQAGERVEQKVLCLTKQYS